MSNKKVKCGTCENTVPAKDGSNDVTMFTIYNKDGKTIKGYMCMDCSAKKNIVLLEEGWGSFLNTDLGPIGGELIDVCFMLDNGVKEKECTIRYFTESKDNVEYTHWKYADKKVKDPFEDTRWMIWEFLEKNLDAVRALKICFFHGKKFEAAAEMRQVEVSLGGTSDDIDHMELSSSKDKKMEAIGKGTPFFDPPLSKLMTPKELKERLRKSPIVPHQVTTCVVCPVCQGRQRVVAGFYMLEAYQSNTMYSHKDPHECQTCKGAGVLWR